VWNPDNSVLYSHWGESQRTCPDLFRLYHVSVVWQDGMIDWQSNGGDFLPGFTVLSHSCFSVSLGFNYKLIHEEDYSKIGCQ
jgi:hypothetical protein